MNPNISYQKLLFRLKFPCKDVDSVGVAALIAPLNEMHAWILSHGVLLRPLDSPLIWTSTPKSIIVTLIAPQRQIVATIAR